MDKQVSPIEDRKIIYSLKIGKIIEVLIRASFKISIMIAALFSFFEMFGVNVIGKMFTKEYFEIIKNIGANSFIKKILVIGIDSFIKSGVICFCTLFIIDLVLLCCIWVQRKFEI